MLDTSTIETKFQIEIANGVYNEISKMINSLKELQTKANAVNEKLNVMISTLCLENDVDFETQGVYLTEDLKTINVYDKPKDEAQETNDLEDSVQEA